MTRWQQSHTLDGLLIDNCGKVWQKSAPALRAHLLCPNYPGDLENDVIRNLGYISLKASKSGVFVKYRPETISDTALATLLFWLSDNQPANVCLRFVESGRPDEIVGNHALAINRISDMQIELELKKRISATHRHVKDVQSDSPLYPLLSYWRSTDGKCLEGELRSLATAHANSRFAFIKLDSALGFVFAELGIGLGLPNQKSIKVTQERPLDKQADTIYYKWVARNYANGLESFRPDVADVDALVTWPGHEPVRHRYRRLLLPCIGDGVPFLFSASSAEFTAATNYMEAV
jgi:hypothetical protein